MAEVVGGAALGAAFGELLKAIVNQTERTTKFNTLLTRLEKTLIKFDPVFKDITELSKVLNRPDDETTMFTHYLVYGKELVEKCSGIKFWDVRKKYIYTNKLIRLDNELVRFFQIEAHANSTRATLMNLIGTNELNDKFDRLVLNATSGSVGFSGSCSVPGLPEFVIGLDQHVKELKNMLLKDEVRVLVVLAPGGFGKTTLVKKLCHDDQIKGTHNSS